MGAIERRGDFWRSLPSGLRIAEIGVFAGDHAREIADEAKPSVLHLVDLFSGLATSGDVDGLNPKTLDMEAELERLRGMEWPCPVEFHATDSISWLTSRRFDSLDVIYLDTVHTYEHLRLEITYSMFAIRPGGWVGGHDYHAGRFPGVVEAVDRLRAEYPDAEFFTTTHDGLPSWFLRSTEQTTHS